jgi:hypothetical protein
MFFSKHVFCQKHMFPKLPIIYIAPTKTVVCVRCCPTQIRTFYILTFFFIRSNKKICYDRTACFQFTVTRVFMNPCVFSQQKHVYLVQFGNSYNRYTYFYCHNIVPLSYTRVFSNLFSCLSRIAGCLFHASHVFRWTRVRTETNIIGLWRVRGLFCPMFQCLPASFDMPKPARAATLGHVLLRSCWTTQDKRRQDKTTQHPTRLGHTTPNKTRAHKPRQDTTRQDKTRQDKARQDKTNHDTTRQDQTSQDKTRQDGNKRQDKTRQDKTMDPLPRQPYASFVRFPCPPYVLLGMAMPVPAPVLHENTYVCFLKPVSYGIVVRAVEPLSP